MIGIGIGKSDESGISANSRSSETHAEQPPSYSETVHTEPTVRQRIRINFIQSFKRQVFRVIGKKVLVIPVRHTKNDESETSTTWSTSTGFGGTSNR